MIERVHYPECNVWCNERGHWLIPSGPQGEPFSHQDDSPPSGEGEAGLEMAATKGVVSKLARRGSLPPPGTGAGNAEATRAFQVATRLPGVEVEGGGRGRRAGRTKLAAPGA